MRKILTTAAFALAAAAVTVVPAAQASAQTGYHHPGQPAVVTSYSCTRYVTGHKHRHPVYGERCEVQVLFTGPQGEWKLSVWTPRRELLTGYEYGTTESSALGSWGMNEKRYAPFTQAGVPDDFEYTGGILPAGQTANGYFWFNVPAGERVPVVSIWASKSPYPGSGPVGGPTPTPTPTLRLRLRLR